MFLYPCLADITTRRFCNYTTNNIQQTKHISTDDPVTDFRSGGVLSLAMLVHIVESCPLVHARFVPKYTNNDNLTTAAPSNDPEMSLEQIITEDASVLPFGITCINVTDMLAKFLMFSKSVDKMDALLSAKPFW
jgi:hypothetical protein